MSYTGTYKYNKETGRVELVKKNTPNTQVFDCYVPEGGYYSDNLECFIHSRAEKRRILAERNLREKSKLEKREI